MVHNNNSAVSFWYLLSKLLQILQDISPPSVQNDYPYAQPDYPYSPNTFNPQPEVPSYTPPATNTQA